MENAWMKGILIIWLLISIVFSSCAPIEPRKEETAQELVDKGMSQFDKGHYREAIQTFLRLRDWYPFSEHTVTADLKIADALYQLSRYEDAVRAYSVFENLHAGNEAVPYAINQTGLCYYNRMDTIDRDQTTAENAIATFQRLVAQYPESNYADNAKGYIRECKERLAGHEFKIALYYFKKKNYQAALQRFNVILTRYPDVGDVHHQAVQYIVLCKEHLKIQPSGTK